MFGTTLDSRLIRLTVLGNFAGTLLTFVYFNFLDTAAHEGSPAMHAGVWVFFVASFGLLFGIIRIVGRRWVRPVVGLAHAPPPGAEGEELRRRALLLPAFFALLSFAGWVTAALIWGVLWPTLLGEFSLLRALRQIFGMTFVAAPIVAASVFLSVERLWRAELPRIFPQGDLSAVRAPRLSVRTRMVAVFLLISLVPTAVLSVAAVTRANALRGADADSAEAIIANLILVVAVLAGGALLVSIRLARFVAGSVAEPLRGVQAAMVQVARGDLNTHCAVVSNDEIGAVAEGFNRMVAGLRERETFGKYVSPEVRAALEMRARLDAWNKVRSAAGKIALRHGIGIHTGTVIAGNIGSTERMSYALVGDAVNLTSRIQALNKDRGTHILVSGVTRAKLAGEYALKPLPTVRVKGRTAEVEVYSLE